MYGFVSTPKPSPLALLQRKMIRRHRLVLCCGIIALVLSSCIETVSLDNAVCPCLAGYYCAHDSVCKPNREVVSGLSGKTYIIEIASTKWTAPPGFAASLDASDDYDDVYPVFAFKIRNVDPRALTFSALLGTVRDGTQDMGMKTYEMSGTLEVVDKDTVVFTLGPKDAQAIVFGPAVEEKKPIGTLASYYDLTFTGTFINQGRQVNTGTLTTVMRADEIYTLFYLAKFEDGKSLCNSFESLDYYRCDLCSDDSNRRLCLTFAAEDLSFPTAPDLVLTTVDDFDGKYI